MARFQVTLTHRVKMLIASKTIRVTPVDIPFDDANFGDVTRTFTDITNLDDQPLAVALARSLGVELPKLDPPAITTDEEGRKIFEYVLAPWILIRIRTGR